MPSLDTVSDLPGDTSDLLFLLWDFQCHCHICSFFEVLHILSPDEEYDGGIFWGFLVPLPMFHNGGGPEDQGHREEGGTASLSGGSLGDKGSQLSLG